MQNGTTLLDIDSDFMLADEYYDCTPRPHWESERQKMLISATDMGEVLRKLITSNTKSYLVVDHHEALYWWDQHGIQNATCFHVDAHHDMWNPATSGGTIKGRRDENIDCGRYLYQAMMDKIVNKTVYVTSSWRSLVSEKFDINRQFEFIDPIGCGQVKVCYWNEFVKMIDDLSVDIVTIAISPEWLPYQFLTEIETLARILRVPDKRIQEAINIANTRYDGVHGAFQFPYDRR